MRPRGWLLEFVNGGCQCSETRDLIESTTLRPLGRGVEEETATRPNNQCVFACGGALLSLTVWKKRQRTPYLVGRICPLIFPASHNLAEGGTSGMPAIWCSTGPGTKSTV